MIRWLLGITGGACYLFAGGLFMLAKHWAADFYDRDIPKKAWVALGISYILLFPAPGLIAAIFVV